MGVLTTALCIGVLLGGVLGVTLSGVMDARDAMAFQSLADARQRDSVLVDSLRGEVENCRYHVTRASVAMSRLETDVARWLRRGRLR